MKQRLLAFMSKLASCLLSVRIRHPLAVVSVAFAFVALLGFVSTGCRMGAIGTKSLGREPDWVERREPMGAAFFLGLGSDRLKPYWMVEAANSTEEKGLYVVGQSEVLSATNATHASAHGLLVRSAISDSVDQIQRALGSAFAISPEELSRLADQLAERQPSRERPYAFTVTYGSSPMAASLCGYYLRRTVVSDLLGTGYPARTPKKNITVLRAFVLVRIPQASTGGANPAAITTPAPDHAE